jgi:hypothetical protein
MPRHVVRIDIEPTEEHPNRSRTHGWQVRINHRGQRATKFFADKKYGGRDEALAVAIEYRDEMLGQLPKPGELDERTAQARSNSGVPGIRLAFKNDVPYVESNWVHAGGRSASSFSIERWGLRKATWKACRSRAVGRGITRPDRVQAMFEKAYPALKASLDRMLAERQHTEQQAA